MENDENVAGWLTNTKERGGAKAKTCLCADTPPFSLGSCFLVHVRCMPGCCFSFFFRGKVNERGARTPSPGP